MQKLLLSFTFALLMITSCSDDAEINPHHANKQTKSIIDRDKIALRLVELLNEPSLKGSIVMQLRGSNSIRLSDVLTQSNARAIQSKSALALQEIIKSANEAIAKEEFPDRVEIPELWMHIPDKAFNENELLIAYPPMEGDEKDWKHVKAYTLDKEVVYLDATKAPQVPVIVVETHGHEAFLYEVELMNKMLQSSGVQLPQGSLASAREAATAAGVETSLLKRISLKNDNEPWISGNAEIYAITTGIRNNLNEPQLKIVPMEYLDDDGKNYYPNQILLFWDEYEYQAANILIYEQDGNYSYKELVTVILKNVLSITGTLSGQAWLTALSEITGAIMQAMPDEWYTNGDDYTDALYTIEKTRSYYNYKGAGGNVSVDIEPYFVSANN